MNKEIKAILDTYKEGLMSEDKLYQFLIEVCELQILRCHVENNSEVCMNILNTKNIAENE